MARRIIEENNLDNVVGGTIIFTSDHKMCGLNCNNQCRVNDFDSALQYINNNKNTQTEAEMMRAMCSLGYITRL